MGRIESGYEDQSLPGLPEPPEDDTFAPATKIEKRTPLKDLKAALAAKVVNEPITLAVPGRPGMEMRFNTNIDADLFEAWQNRCMKRKGGKATGDLDTMRLSCIVIANQAEVLIWHGDDQTTEDGDAPLNFRTPELAQLLGADSTNSQAVVRALYGVDGHVLQVAQRIVREAGYDEIDLESEEDPTR